MALQLGGDYLYGAIADKVQPGDIIICRNSDQASRRSGDPTRYPTLTPSAAEWLALRGIKMVGIDNSFRLGKDIADGRALHDILMSRGVTLIEWLDNLEAISRPAFFFMAVPYKVKTMDSSWCRAIAIVER